MPPPSCFLHTCPRCGRYQVVLDLSAPDASECQCAPDAPLPPADDILEAASEKHAAMWNAESRLSVATSFIDSLPLADRLRFATHAYETAYADFLAWQEDFLRWEQRDATDARATTTLYDENA